MFNEKVKYVNEINKKCEHNKITCIKTKSVKSSFNTRIVISLYMLNTGMDWVKLVVG